MMVLNAERGSALTALTEPDTIQFTLEQFWRDFEGTDHEKLKGSPNNNDPPLIHNRFFLFI